MIAAFNDTSIDKQSKTKSNNDMSIHLCTMCSNQTSFSKIEIPYAFKLLMQELQSINVVPRIITE